MSSNYAYPGQAYAHTLTALKGWYKEMALDAECALSSNVNLAGTGQPVHSGTVVHATGVNANTDVYGSPMNGPGTLVVEMGCGADDGIPLFLWPGENDRDISNPGVPAGTSAAGDATYGPPDFLPVLPQITNQNMPALVGSGGYELESSEFDGDQTYATGQYLRTVTSNTDANGGKLTNQDASGGAPFATSALLTVGTDTVVGIVSRGEYVNGYRKAVLAFWTWFIRGTR